MELFKPYEQFIGPLLTLLLMAIVAPYLRRLHRLHREHGQMIQKKLLEHTGVVAKEGRTRLETVRELGRHYFSDRPHGAVVLEVPLDTGGGVHHGGTEDTETKATTKAE